MCRTSSVINQALNNALYVLFVRFQNILWYYLNKVTKNYFLVEEVISNLEILSLPRASDSHGGLAKQISGSAPGARD